VLATEADLHAQSAVFDLPSRVLAAVDAGLSCRQAATRFGVSASSAIRWQAPEAHASLIRQVLLAHDDASTTVPETCRVLGISKSSYYAALREGRWQALEAAEAA
jgi:hypothetical protein